MFEGLMKVIKGMSKRQELIGSSKDTAKERLHLVLMQDRANVSVDFLDLMKQEILDVIKKYIEVDENSIDVRLTNKPNGDGTMGAPSLYANIPILDIKEELLNLDYENKNKKIEEPKENSRKIETNKTSNSNNSQNTNKSSSGSKSTNANTQAKKTQNKQNSNNSQTGKSNKKKTKKK